MGRIVMLPPSPLLHSPDESRVRIDLDAYCQDCKRRHRLGLTPQGFNAELWEWEAKHHGHDIEFLSPRRRIPRRFQDWMFEKVGWAPWWLAYDENVNFKIAYAASTALTCGLATGPLASSATFIAGRECTSIDNTANLYIDYRITAKITTGTTPTVNTEIRIYGYVALNDTPLYPDTITGTDSNVTITNTQILNAAFVPMGEIDVSAVSNVGYPIKCLTVAQAFGHAGHRWGLFVVHNTGVALNATAGNHVLTQKGAYLQG